MLPSNNTNLRQTYSLTYTIPDGFSWIYLHSGGYYENIQTGNAFATTPKNTILLAYILKGCGIERRSGKEYNQQSLFISREKLSIEPKNANTILTIAICNADEFINVLSGTEIETVSQELHWLFVQLHNKLVNETITSIYHASFECYTLMMLLLKNANEQKLTAQPSILVKKALDLIDEQFFCLEGVEALSNQLEVSKYHLIRRFSKELGQTPGKYMHSVRIEYAKALLLHYEYTVAQIAYMIGFGDANYFGKKFRETVGLSPGRYRSAYQHKSTALNQSKKNKIQQLEDLYFI